MLISINIECEPLVLCMLSSFFKCSTISKISQQDSLTHCVKDGSQSIWSRKHILVLVWRCRKSSRSTPANRWQQSSNSEVEVLIQTMTSELALELLTGKTNTLLSAASTKTNSNLKHRYPPTYLIPLLSTSFLLVKSGFQVQACQTPQPRRSHAQQFTQNKMMLQVKILAYFMSTPVFFFKLSGTFPVSMLFWRYL